MRRSSVCHVALGIAIGLWTVGAGADAISPIAPCEPGTARGGSGVMGGFIGHGGAPPCEPAVCTDASTCGDAQVCRRDAHCVAMREVTETVPGPSHGSVAPGSTRVVTRSFDLGRCASDGACPAGSRCLEVATCRAADAVDDAPAATDGARGMRAAGAWSSAGPRTDATLGPVAPPVPEPVLTPPEAPVSPLPLEAPASPPTPPRGTCGCRAAQANASLALVCLGLVGALRLRYRARACLQAPPATSSISSAAHRSSR